MPVIKEEKEIKLEVKEEPKEEPNWEPPAALLEELLIFDGEEITPTPPPAVSVLKREPGVQPDLDAEPDVGLPPQYEPPVPGQLS